MKSNLIRNLILPLSLAAVQLACVKTPDAVQSIQQVSTVPAEANATVLPCPVTEPLQCSDDGASQPALYGMWLKQDGDSRNLLIISAKSVYLVEDIDKPNNYIRESFFEVRSVDWTRGEMDLYLTWVRINGEYGGFDSPSKVMKITIDVDTLHYSIVDIGSMTEPPVNGPWLRQ